jgi:ferrous iron transport protein B
MIGLFTLVIWLTIEGANVPSSMLATFFLDWLYPILKDGTDAWPWWLSGLLIDGMYLATAWVISVMLPPMAIFFPMFTLLEDLGYLPRVAFNLDGLFKKAGAHGKQALSMMMGFGCNAAGVISTRIIDSPRERLIAIITNNFSLCNGRWPTIIILSSLFVGALAPAWFAGFATALSVVAIALLGVALTFLASWMLSKSVLKGEASAFSLELPPYRPPKIMQTLYTSIIDRTIFVLWRAIIFALPAGAAIWLSSNIMVGDISVAEYIINALDPIGWVIGLNGVILLAYIVAIPANEIIIPTILMLTVLTTGMSGVGSGAGVMFEPEDMSTLSNVLQAGGWTLLTAISVMLFSLMHNPCSTTIYTIYKETKSVKWTVMATLLPYGFGITILIVLAAVWRAFA